MKDSFEEEFKDMELFKMKNELTLFVSKMKSEGFLASVDYQDIPDLQQFEKTDY